MGLLDGKAGIITGAGRGVAGAAASLLAAEGARPVVADYGVALDGTTPDPSVAEEKVAAIQAAGGEATALASDVTNSDDCDLIVQTCIDHCGKIDFAIAAAGILRDRMVFNMSDVEHAAVLDVHLKGTFYVGRAAARAMRQQRFGAIVTVTSASQEGLIGQSNYSAAKGGIASMTYVWAWELRRYGINANSVLPAARTRMVTSIPGQEQAPEEIEPGSSMGTADQVAPIFVYLCSDEAKWITGQVIGLGGERLALWQHPRERIIVTQRGGFSLDDVRRTIPSVFQGQLEPYGLRQNQYEEVGYATAQEAARQEKKR